MKYSRIAVRPLPSVECVISLAPTISALKQKFPGVAVGLVAEESLREASHLLPDLDFFINEQDALGDDHVIDLVGAEALENSGESPLWKPYLNALEQISMGNPYHLVDLLRKCAQVDTVDVNFELAAPDFSGALPDSLSGAGGVRVALCADSLGHAEIDAVLEGLANVPAGAEVFLVGSATPIAPWDGKLSVHDLRGKLGLSGNAAVLRGSDIAIVGPGTHGVISSGYGTFTIGIDQNPARGPALYPYGHGHLLIQRAVTGKLETMLAPVIEKIVRYALSANNGNVPSLEQWQVLAESLIPEYLAKVRILATQRIEILFKDGGSFTELYQRPLLFAGSELYDVFQTFYRLLWEHSLNERSVTTYDLQVLHQDTMPLLCDLLKPLEQLYELGNFGKVYSGYVRDNLAKGDLAQAKYESTRLQEVEELVNSLVSTQLFFAPLGAYHRQCQRLMDAENPLALSDEMASLFSQLQSRVLVLLDLARSLFHTVFENESALAAKPAEEGNLHG